MINRRLKITDYVRRIRFDIIIAITVSLLHCSSDEIFMVMEEAQMSSLGNPSRISGFASLTPRPETENLLPPNSISLIINNNFSRPINVR